MSTQGVIPSWPKTDEHLFRRLREHVHYAQDSSGICEMLEGVDGCGRTGSSKSCPTSLHSTSRSRVIPRVRRSAVCADGLLW